MTNLPIYILLFLISCFGVYKYFCLRSVYLSLKAKENKLKDADYVILSSEKILENDKNKYEQVIEESYKKAQVIIKDAKVFNDDTKQQVLAELGKSIQTITAEIKQETLEEVEVQKQATQRLVESDYDQVKVDVERYKKEQFAAIDKQVADKVAMLVNQITKEVLGHGIAIKDQEELVIKSLENARKQSIL